jgi:hypothetical protein
MGDLMFKKNTVFWTFDSYSFDQNFDSNNLKIGSTFLAPEPVFKKINRYKHIVDGNNFLKCPVTNSFLKKTFNILSPIDYSLLSNPLDNKIVSNHQDQFFFDKFVSIRDFKTKCISLNFLYYAFFTDKTCNMTWNRSYFSEGDFSFNVEIIPGTYDISKWLRRVELAFFIKYDNKLLLIKRGEPISSVHFDFFNNDTISLKYFKCTDNIRSFLNFANIRRYSDCKNNLYDRMNYLYGQFHNSIAKKTLIQEIKNNLLE